MGIISERNVTLVSQRFCSPTRYFDFKLFFQMQNEENSLPANNSSLHSTLVSRNETLLKSSQQDLLECTEDFFYIQGAIPHIENLTQLLSSLITDPKEIESLDSLREEFRLKPLDKGQTLFMTSQLINFITEAQYLFDRIETYKEILEELKKTE